MRFAGDAVIAAFFSAEKDRDRERHRDELLEQFFNWFESGSPDPAKPIEASIEQLKTGSKAIGPFHWHIEFPEVFERSQSGFDAIVGNPPFMGGSKVSSTRGAQYRDWLLVVHDESHGNADVVAHFFRRSFNLIRSSGSLGLIATNTLCQGDTRSTGLRSICTGGGTIYAAQKRYVWPGQAAVVVSVVHIFKGQMLGPFQLGSRTVQIITAYLSTSGGHDDPAMLAANSNKRFLGAKTYGQGFVFDDDDPECNSIEEMKTLIDQDPRNQERIFPYIGGKEVNETSGHAAHRFVISFAEMTEAEARRWPNLMAIVEDKVKPQRMNNNREGYRR